MRDFCRAHGLSTASLCAWRRTRARQGDAGLQAQPNPRNAGGRTRPPYTPEARRQAVEAFGKSGLTRADFARLWGITGTTLSTWLKRYGESGPQGLEQPYAKGKRRGPPRKALPPPLQAEITKVVRRHPLFGLKKVRDYLRRFAALSVSVRQVRRVVEQEAEDRPAKRAPRLVAAEPLVAGLPADAEARAQLGHREDLELAVGDEASSLVHG